MAWIKEIVEENTGTVVSYWEVISVFYSHKDRQSDLVVGGWISKQAFDDKKDPVIVKSWGVPAGAAPELSAGAVTFVTNFARAQDMFDGNTDVT